VHLGTISERTLVVVVLHVICQMFAISRQIPDAKNKKVEGVKTQEHSEKTSVHLSGIVYIALVLFTRLEHG
jgi:hypothetical protein